MTEEETHMLADSFNADALHRNLLTIPCITRLVMFWQAHHSPLIVDGKAGPRTITSLADFTLEWPLPELQDGRKPRVTSGFRQPDRPHHPGLDIMYARRPGDPHAPGDDPNTTRWWVPDGTPAFAAHSGTVLSAERIATGYRIWIQGEGFCTGYFHLSAMLIARGRNVMAGTPIGIIGNNPIDTDPNHLHFEMIRGAFIDYPLNLIDPEPHLPEVA